MRNFKDETLETLKDCGKTPEDIVWIGFGDYRISIDDFWQFIDYEYEPEDNWVMGDSDLVIMGDGWWLERSLEDIFNEWNDLMGVESVWDYNKIPTMPEKIEKVDIVLRKLKEN